MQAAGVPVTRQPPDIRQQYRLRHPTLSKTRHKNPRTAMRYVKPGAEAIAKVTEHLAPPRGRQ
jgi:hypothetical protein